MSDNNSESLGRYEVVEEIVRSSMGAVHLGHDPYIDRAIAIKVVYAEHLNDEVLGDRYRKIFF